MIKFKDVSFAYHSTEHEDGVHHLNFSISRGQVVVLCGESGCGKTTITRLINGLIPEYYEGALHGEVLFDTLNVSKVPLHETSKRIGSVFQNPRSQFFNVDTTGEIAFGCENTGIAKEEIFKRIGQVATELNIWDLLDRSLFALSGGEKQKIACASVSAMLPEVLVLDEPSSNLDVATIGFLKEVIKRWKSMGKTVIIAEHRLYYLMGVADRLIYMKDGTIAQDMSNEQFMELSDDKLHSMGLRSLFPTDFESISETKFNGKQINLKNISFNYGKNYKLNIPALSFPQGAIIGILGHNGAGKTTFAKCLCGLMKNSTGVLELNESSHNTKQRIQMSYMVMQDVNHQLFTESVYEEIFLSMTCTDADNVQISEILTNLKLEKFEQLHPMSLSGGQKQRVAIGSAIASNKPIIIYDEPTSGLDYHHMLQVAYNLKKLSEFGKTQFIITHDPELLAQCCNYFIFIEKGKIAWSGGWDTENKQRIAEFFAPAVTAC